MSFDSENPQWPPTPQPPMAEAEPTETAPKKRPAWFGWAIGGLAS
jgi:hypothetical protein